jgi:hypothetical protein
MSQYRTGLVSVTNGSQTVVGDTTLFLANVTAGDLFVPVGDNVSYQIASITDNTHLVLSTPYAGTTGTGKLYTIARDFTPILNLPYTQKGDIETATILKTALMALDHAIAFNTDITSPATGQLLGYNGTDWVNTTLAGTTSEIIVTPSTGTLTLSLPQAIATTSSPTFAGLSLTSPNTLDYVSSINVAAHGVDTTGTTDCTTIVQGLQNLIDTVGGPFFGKALYWPPGTYKCGQITYQFPPVWFGDSPASTIIKPASGSIPNNQFLLKFFGNQNNTITAVTPLTITSTGTTISVTFAALASAPTVGNLFCLKGVVPQIYNSGFYTITASTTTSVTLSSGSTTRSGTVTSLGHGYIYNQSTFVVNGQSFKNLQINGSNLSGTSNIGFFSTQALTNNNAGTIENCWFFNLPNGNYITNSWGWTFKDNLFTKIGNYSTGLYQAGLIFADAIWNSGGNESATPHTFINNQFQSCWWDIIALDENSTTGDLKTGAHANIKYTTFYNHTTQGFQNGSWMGLASTGNTWINLYEETGGNGNDAYGNAGLGSSALGIQGFNGLILNQELASYSGGGTNTYNFTGSLVVETNGTRTTYNNMVSTTSITASSGAVVVGGSLNVSLTSTLGGLLTINANGDAITQVASGDVTSGGTTYHRFNDINGNAAYVGYGGGNALNIFQYKALPILISTNNTTVATFPSTGGLNIAVPTSGAGLTIQGGGLTISGGGASITGAVTTSSTLSTGNAATINANGAGLIQVSTQDVTTTGAVYHRFNDTNGNAGFVGFGAFAASRLDLYNYKNGPIVLSTNSATALTVAAGGNVTAVGSVQGTQLISTIATGTAPLSVTSTTQVANLNAASAGNLTGGAAGSLPYQTGAGATSLLAAGTSSQVLVSGTTPAWTNTPTLTGTNFTGIPNAALTNSSVTITAGTGMSGGGAVALGSSITLTNAGVISITGTTNQVVASASTGAVTLSLPQSIATTSGPTFATLGLSSAGASLIQTTSGDVTTTGAVYHRFNDTNGNAGYIGFGGTASTLNLYNYKNGPIVISTNGTTALTISAGGNATAVGTVQGTQLISTIATGTAPLSVTSTTQVANLNAASAGNLTGGAAGSLPYQSGAGVTAMLAAGSSGQVLQSVGSTAPVWTFKTPVQASVNLTTQAANVAVTTIVGASTLAGLYSVSIYMGVTQAATSSSTLPDITIGWTDADTSVVRSMQVTAGNSGNTTSTSTNGDVVINAKAATNITYTIGGNQAYASSGATAMQYACHIRLQYLG